MASEEAGGLAGVCAAAEADSAAAPRTTPPKPRKSLIIEYPDTGPSGLARSSDAMVTKV